MISLKSIERPSVLTPKQHEIVLGLLGSLVTTNDHIKTNKSLFADYNSELKILDKQLAKKINNVSTIKRVLKTKAMAEYLVGKTQVINLPGSGVRQDKYDSIKDLIVSHYLYPFFQDKNTISDNVLYMWFDLFKNIQIQKISDGELNMYFGAKPMDMFQFRDEQPFSFEYYSDYSRDKLLQKEIELGYTNKVIGDKGRGYGYTHMLRANVGEYMTMPASAIKLILNWSKFNMYLTSRKQGKTSFAADRIVAELLTEKRGYGMRKHRRIKFFTDNASKVGVEVMQFIQDFLGDLVNQEIRPGVKYFEIKETKQEVICNLTGNSFAVVSLKGLQGDADNSTGDGLACDCAIIDEGFRITYRFWKSFKDRAMDECDWILFISTLNEETEITHWGYDELIKGEAGCNPDFNTVRSSDFDNSITYFNNFLRKGLTMKDYYASIWTKLHDRIKEVGEQYVMKRMLCGILSDEVLFNVTGRIIASNTKALETDLRIVGMDMGGLSDHIGVCSLNALQLIIEEGYSQSIEGRYEKCIEMAREYKEKYPNIIIVGDMGGPVGEAVYILDQKTKYIDYWIKTTGNSGSVNEKDGYYTMKKGTFITAGSHALSNTIKVMIGCQDLIAQFGDMEMKKSTRGSTILYKAKSGRKDDAVFAFLNIFGLLTIIFQLLSKEDIIEFAKEHSGSELITVDESEAIYYTGGMTY